MQWLRRNSSSKQVQSSCRKLLENSFTFQDLSKNLEPWTLTWYENSKFRTLKCIIIDTRADSVKVNKTVLVLFFSRHVHNNVKKTSWMHIHCKKIPETVAFDHNRICSSLNNNNAFQSMYFLFQSELSLEPAFGLMRKQQHCTSHSKKETTASANSEKKNFKNWFRSKENFKRTNGENRIIRWFFIIFKDAIHPRVWAISDVLSNPFWVEYEDSLGKWEVRTTEESHEISTRKLFAEKQQSTHAISSTRPTKPNLCLYESWLLKIR